MAVRVPRRARLWLSVAAFWALCYWYLGPSFSLPVGSRSDPLAGWLRRPAKNPVLKPTTIPSGHAKATIPRIQADDPVEPEDVRQRRVVRQAAVKESFQHSWAGYYEHAWLHDEVTPLTGKHNDPFGGWAATLVDALDTLWIMGLKDDFARAVAASASIDFTKSPAQIINVFETTIRYLGGFLGAYELSEKKYPVLLEKAVEVGDVLMRAFDTPNHMPVLRWDWKNYARGAPQAAQKESHVSELGSMSLEFTKLSQLTGDMKYYDAVQRLADHFETSQDNSRLPGMWPVDVDAYTPAFHAGTDFTLGGMSDSLYEYLPKQYLLLGGALDQPRHLYEKFLPVAKKNLFWRAMVPWHKPVVISGDVKITDLPGESPKYTKAYRGQHLTCFAGGMIGMASRIFDKPEDLELAAQLTEGCVWSYKATRSGLGPEVFNFVPCGSVGSTAAEQCEWDEKKWLQAVEAAHESHFHPPQEGNAKNWEKPTVEQLVERFNIPRGMSAVEDARYILRPEAIESIFIMYRLTGDASWMDKAWDMFVQIEKVTRTKIASSAVNDVTKDKPVKMDSMESFWLAETLKYFYLIFSDFNVLSLDKWVLNTEAHPLSRPSPSV